MILKGFIIFCTLLTALQAYSSEAGIWKIQVSPLQISCPSFNYHIALKENKLVKLDILNQGQISQVHLNLSKNKKLIAQHFINGEQIYSFESYLFANKVMIDFTGIGKYKKCFGEVSLSKTRLMNARWRFKFMPDMLSLTRCAPSSIDVFSIFDKIQSRSSNYMSNNLQGTIDSGDVDTIDATANISGVNIELEGMISFAWGSAKGIFKSSSACAGRFEAKLISKPRELTSSNSSSPQWHI
jgi:hypothetical protein